jgi:hypothetical protein
MSKPNRGGQAENLARMAAERKRLAEIARRDYRSRALKLFDHVCGSCGREFKGKRLRELTVHHRDGDYKNNPPDGSNWELLCLFCHDYEHEHHSGTAAGVPATTEPGTFSMFDNLDDLLSTPKDNEEED